MHNIRQRTAAQRSSREDEGEVLIQDEQEQEEEIASLRKKDQATNALTRRVLDFSILFTIIVCLINVYRALTFSHYSMVLITVIQTINLIFNLTPDTIPPFHSIPGRNLLGLLLATCVVTLCGCTTLVRGRGHLGSMETVTLFAPLLVSLGAWVQKKGEVDTESSLAELERARYKMKGA